MNPLISAMTDEIAKAHQDLMQKYNTDDISKERVFLMRGIIAGLRIAMTIMKKAQAVIDKKPEATTEYLNMVVNDMCRELAPRKVIVVFAALSGKRCHYETDENNGLLFACNQIHWNIGFVQCIIDKETKEIIYTRQQIDEYYFSKFIPERVNEDEESTEADSENTD